MEKAKVIAAIKAAGSNPCFVMYDEGFRAYCGLENHFLLDGGDYLIAISPNSGADPYPKMNPQSSPVIVKYIDYDCIISVDIFSNGTSDDIDTLIPASAAAIYNDDTIDSIKNAIAKSSLKRIRSPRGFNKEFNKDTYDNIYGKSDAINIDLT